MLKNLFRSRERTRPGLALYEAAVAQARQPGFYRRLNVADRIDARFELYTLHVLLLVMRLREEPEPEAQAGAEIGQDLFDTYVSALDNSLRELGVHDVTISKKMRKLGEALYGRMTAYEPAIRTGDAAGLAEGLARNVYEVEGADVARGLAAYALEARAGLAQQTMKAVLTAPQWPEIAA